MAYVASYRGSIGGSWTSELLGFRPERRVNDDIVAERSLSREEFRSDLRSLGRNMSAPSDDGVRPPGVGIGLASGGGGVRPGDGVRVVSGRGVRPGDRDSDADEIVSAVGVRSDDMDEIVSGGG